MEIKCTIDNTRSTKQGLKVTLFLDKAAKTEFLKGQANFEDKPLLINFQVDSKEQQNILGRINEGQRNKLYVLFKEIAAFQGESNPEAVKVNLKYLYRKAYEIPEHFSLSDCTKERASEFITFIVGWCLMNSIGLNTSPRELLEDDDIYFYLCNRQRKCCVCGEHGEIITGKEDKKICLCGTHHNEAKDMRWPEFMQYYHLKAITMP